MMAFQQIQLAVTEFGVTSRWDRLTVRPFTNRILISDKLITFFIVIFNINGAAIFIKLYTITLIYISLTCVHNMTKY